MSSTSIVDKVYLALELTKIRYNGLSNDDTKDIEADKNVLETYLYYIEELTGIKIEELENMPKLKKKLADTLDKYKELHDTMINTINSMIENNNKDAIAVIEELKGDMEPFVYKTLKDILTKKVK